MKIKWHHVYIVTYVFNWISFSVVNCKRRVGKPPRHLCAFYLFRERRASHPPQRSAHSIKGRVMITLLTMVGRFTTSPCCLVGSFSWSKRDAATGGRPWNVIRVESRLFLFSSAMSASQLEFQLINLFSQILQLSYPIIPTRSLRDVRYGPLPLWRSLIRV